MADAIREFNNFVVNDSRVDVVTLPFRDGVSIITRRRACTSDKIGAIHDMPAWWGARLQLCKQMYF